VLSPERQNLLTSLLFLNIYTGSINERIKHKLLSLTYKVLTTNQPQHLHDLISVQPCHDTRFFIYGHSCSPTSPLLFENHKLLFSVCCAPCQWNELPTDLREPRQIQSPSLSLHFTHGSSSSSSSPSSLSPLASSPTRSVYHSELTKTWLFGKSFPPYRPFRFLPD